MFYPFCSTSETIVSDPISEWKFQTLMFGLFASAVGDEEISSEDDLDSRMDELLNSMDDLGILELKPETLKDRFGDERLSMYKYFFEYRVLGLEYFKNDPKELIEKLRIFPDLNNYLKSSYQ